MRYLCPLLERIERGEIDPTFIVTHRLSLEEAPDAYRIFRDKEENCLKVVLKPFQDGGQDRLESARREEQKTDE